MAWHRLLLAALLAVTAGAQEEIHRNKTMILMLGGFRWDYLSLLGGETGGFKEFIKGGVAAEYVKTVFPSLSYPAWATISTGVYPETHGILGNFFYNRQRKSLFQMNDTTTTKRAYWWQQPQPVWTAANKQGLRVATILWARSEVLVQGLRPEEARGYEFIEDTLGNLRSTLDQSLDYLVRGFDLVMAYSDHLDDVGHRYGPDSLEMKYSVGDVAKLLLGLFRQLEERKLKDKVNVIVLGDHGMATPDPGDPIKLRQYLDPQLDVEMALGQGAFVSIYAKPGRVEYVYNRLAPVDGLIVWKRGQVPRELRYNRNSLLPDIIVTAKKGVFIETEDQNSGYMIRGLNVPEGVQSAKPMGVHGYTPDVEQMRTVFYAVGPDFKKHVRTGPMELVDVYQVLCHTLRLRPEPNNGTWSRVRAMFPDDPIAPFGEQADDVEESAEGEEDNDDVDDLLVPTPIRDTSRPGPSEPPAPPAAPSPGMRPPAPASAPAHALQPLLLAALLALPALVT